MKKNFAYIALFLIVVASLPFGNVLAQNEAPLIVDTTRPVDGSIRSAVEAWLGLSAPVPLPYWAITYVEARGEDTLVSIVALDIFTPSDPWHFTDSNDVAWLGTVIVHADYSVEMYSSEPEPTSGVIQLASLVMPDLPASAGGGVNIRFPWQAGGTMMYGPDRKSVVFG